MTQDLREEFDQYIENIDTDSFELPSYLPGFHLAACLQDSSQKKTFVLENEAGRKILCKYASEEFKSMLKTESDGLRMGKIPFVPYVIDYQETADGAFLLREYIEGFTLKELVSEKGPLSLEDAISVIRKVCRALSYFHNMTPPIIHRDIKPSNIVLTDKGDCYFIDIGTVRRYQEGASTDTVCMGTLDFAAPEQFGARQTDARTDIYSVGILFYYLLTGSQNLNPLKMLPKKVSAVIKKCTAFDPDKRYENIAQLEKALDGLQPNKKLLRWQIGVAASLLCALMLLSILIIPKLGSGTQAVDFSSPLLEQAVREELRKPAGEPILKKDLKNITRLLICGTTLYHNEYEHECFYHPHHINGEEIVYGDISDISVLAQMPNLRYLSLDYQRIVDISPLKDLPLVSVSLAGNPLNDISPLARNEMLNSLNIADTYVFSLEALKGCSRLSTLDCAYSSVEALAPLAGLNLKELDMLDIPATDYETLENLPLLTLRCQDIHLPDALPHFAKIPNLQNLTIYNCGLTSLGQLSELKQLKFLDIWNNSIHDFKGGGALSGLTSLNVGNNPLTDLDDISEMKSVTDLYIATPNVQDYSFLYKIPWLNSLQVPEENIPRVLEAVPDPWFRLFSP